MIPSRSHRWHQAASNRVSSSSLFICNMVVVRQSICWLLGFAMGCSDFAFADDSTSKIREGMRQYAADQFDEASKSFASATEQLEKAKSDRSAIAAYDEACALHRKGDLDLARERYLKAGLSQNKEIATNAHFNIGVLASEQARRLAGETPEKASEEQRKEILGELGKSIDSYRHCLELQPGHVPARKNLELLRQWTKYYTDRWREVDLQKRRNETNLIQFLEYMIQAQLAIKETAAGFRANTSPNSFAELKRVQDDLREEIPFLKDKIESELRPPVADASNSPTNAKPANNDEVDRGIALLSGWADEAEGKMKEAAKNLMNRDSKAAAEKQKGAADQLDQIWDAVIPFQPLLAKELGEQSSIAKQLNPPPVSENETEPAADKSSAPTSDDAAAEVSKLRVDDEQFPLLIELQSTALRKTRLLGPKAQNELEQVESQPTPTKNDETKDPPVEESNEEPTKVDPEAVKAGLQKAIELAPRAVEEMESAVKALNKKQRSQAAANAEEARRILQEILDAQPKEPKQNDQEQNKDEKEDQQKDQKGDNEQKKDGNKDKQEQDKKEPKDEQKNQEDKQEDKKEKEDKSKEGKEKKDEQPREPKVSQDRIEEMLRRVREREQEKRERDRELKARILGRVPVDKDW